MILVDTNVLSEPMKPTANATVLSWLDKQQDGTLYLAATSFAESLSGIELLPKGRRKQVLSTTFETLVRRLFKNRVLPFDDRAAVEYSRAVAIARSKGRSISIADGQIAAIAAVHGFTVATRDTAPFLAAGVPVLNPWQE
ncbi:type II toxin-antitoxin system VapC family toxin [Granulicella aggregans]|uniref:type II toxin-antitoxin system VapC family toxin n=1 Tax=Granulicella aggregans TaxID=474949 RepID=UPI0021DF74EA|nr:type II toxin-antitoxin system VapC family toxin [Granulicella aggregans]